MLAYSQSHHFLQVPDGEPRRDLAGNQLNTSFVEIALADEEEGKTGGSEAGSRPVTVLRRGSQNSPAEGKTGQRRTPTGKSWEAYKHTEEEVHESHTAFTIGEDDATQYTNLPHQSQDYDRPCFTSQDSLTLPDSLNEFEGEEYQSPALYPDSLGAARAPHLACLQDADSLQFAVSPTPAPCSKSPLDSLIAIKNDARAKMTAGEFFDSITSIEKSKHRDENKSKRRIIPYCDNSLSSGTSAFTSQDVSFDSKDSSPSDTDRARQVVAPPSMHQ